MRAVLIAGLLLIACEPRLLLGDRCARTSECPDPFVCAFERCREACVTFRDCPIGSTCLLDESTGSHVCRVPVEAGCAGATDCPAGLVCDGDRCAQPCTETADCSDLVCADTETARICVEPTGAECTTGAECSWGVCLGGRCDEVRGLAAGGGNTCVLLESGDVECAGDDSTWVIAEDDGAPIQPTFRLLRDGFGEAPPFEALALGDRHVCALAAGEVRCWGAGDLGATGGPTSRTAPFPEPLVSLSGVRELALGEEHSCARRATDLVCWGTDRFGLLGDAMEYPALPGVDPSRAAPGPVEIEGPLRDVDAGHYHACAVDMAGDVWCWGANDHLNCGVPDTGERCTTTVTGTPLSCVAVPRRVPGIGVSAGFPVVEVTVGLQHTCVRGHEGEVRCWGGNSQAQIGDGTAPGPDVMLGGTVLTGAISLQAGNDHTCALLGDGRVACWGRDASGELGDGGGGARTTPSFVPGIDRATTLAVGSSHACVLEDDGIVSCWGSDAFGQLGDGSTDPSPRAPSLFPAVVRSGRSAP